jgi:hypothetical protein
MNLDGVNQIIMKGESLPRFDYHYPLLSLPLAFKTEFNNIPPVPHLIYRDEEKERKWNTKLSKKMKLRLGLVWSGNISHQNGHNRSLSLFKLLPYLPSNIEYICLQK